MKSSSLLFCGDIFQSLRHGKRLNGSYERGRGTFRTTCWHLPTHIEEGRHARIRKFSEKVVWERRNIQHLVCACCHGSAKMLWASIFNHFGGCYIPLSSESTGACCTWSSLEFDFRKQGFISQRDTPGLSVRNAPPRTSWRFHHSRMMSTSYVAERDTKQRENLLSDK